MLPTSLALACVALATPVPGGDGKDLNDWLELDREITSLHRSIGAGDDAGIKFGVDVIASAQSASGAFFDPAPGKSLSGFVLRRVRLTGKGDVGRWSYKISAEGSGGVFALRDAYADWNASESSVIRVGRYKQPLFWGGYASAFLELFHDKTTAAGQNDGRDLGAYWNHSIGQWSWILSAQNGVDAQADDMLFTGRVQYDLIGDTAFGEHFSAYGYDDQTHFSVAFGGASEKGITNGEVLGFEAGLITSGFAFRVDAASYDDLYDTGVVAFDPDEILGTSKAGTSPFSATMTYIFASDRWEMIGRYENFDDTEDTRRSSAGIVYYSDLGPGGRVSLLLQEVTGAPGLDGTRIELSLALKSGT